MLTSTQMKGEPKEFISVMSQENKPGDAMRNVDTQRVLTLIEKIKYAELDCHATASERGRLFKEMKPTEQIDREIAAKIMVMQMLTEEYLKIKYRF